MKKLLFVAAAAGVALIFSCNDSSKETAFKSINDSVILNKCEYHLTDIVVGNIFSPPVASRVYSYCTLAYYEALRQQQRSSPSITSLLKGFPDMPKPDTYGTCNFTVAAVHAFFSAALQVTFSESDIQIIETDLLAPYKASINAAVFDSSLSFGKAVADSVMKRSKSDNYKQTRSMPRYSVLAESSKWQQTPPDYMDAIEPYWGLMKPMFLDSAQQFKPVSPTPYSDNKESDFYKQMMEVYNTSKNLTAEQDSIAHFWDDNAFVVEHSGHMMFATKKTTPGGHWLGITSQLCSNNNLNNIQRAQAFTLVSVAMYDAFISCWDEKYRSVYPRPVTVIKHMVDENWEPVLQTPPFPEYTSGHSVLSNSVAKTLIQIFGDKQAFTDTTEMEFQGLKRSFTSIQGAADEACISRLYGGIHFRPAIEEGKKQGQAIGDFFAEKVITKILVK